MSAVFHLRAAQADREGYYHTRWDLATPVEVEADTKGLALTAAEAILGPPTRGHYWAYKVDKIVAARPCERCAP